MKIIVTGSTGLIGSALVPFLKQQGHVIKRLIREKKGNEGEEVGFWDPDRQILDSTQLEGYDAIINLSGENISKGRWTDSKKERILASRVNATRLLASTIANMSIPPFLFISSSAIGFYGNRGNEDLNEKSSKGEGFLADVCQKWEKAADKAIQKGIRVVFLRSGMILSEKGGALKMMLTPFKIGLGGRIGSGDQYISWISLEDILNIIQFTLNQKSLSGPINAVSPNPVINKEFTKILGRLLHRPTFFPIPAFAARLVFGQMADELFLASTKVYPACLLTEGYQYSFPILEEAFKHHLRIPRGL